MFDVVVLARGGEARQHHKDVRGLGKSLCGRRQVHDSLVFCCWFGWGSQVFRRAVFMSPFFSLLLVFDRSFAACWRLMVGDNALGEWVLAG